MSNNGRSVALFRLLVIEMAPKFASYLVSESQKLNIKLISYDSGSSCNLVVLYSF